MAGSLASKGGLRPVDVMIRTTDEMREQKELKNNEPATEKQKKFMKNPGIKFPETVTKQQASMLIDEDLGRNN